MGALNRLDLACEIEPIHAPDAIQSWGALLIADASDFVVRYASANLEAFLPVAALDAIGRTLEDVIGSASFERLLTAESVGNIGFAILDSGAPAKFRLSATLHSLEGYLYVEIEPSREGQAGAPVGGGWTRGRKIVEALRGAQSTSGLFAIATAELRRLTGFDRVLVYRFDADHHGEVIAESCCPELKALLGLHFPAVDIPPQARAIFARVGLRVISDSFAPPIKLLAGSDTAPSPDLSLTLLRTPSPCHLEYLRNFGSHATATIPITVDGGLWGLLACHHSVASHVPPAVRALCELLGVVTSLMVATLRDAESRALEALRRSRIATMTARLGTLWQDPEELGSALAEQTADLLALCDATGAIIRLGGHAYCCGDAPGGSASEALLAALLSLAPPGDAPYACDRLGDVLPAGLLATVPQARGALLLPLIHCKGDAIVWLRPEQTTLVRWGGDPNRPMNVDAVTGHLSPRNSFVIWNEEVHGRSLPWLPGQIDAARELRREMNQLLAGYTESMRVARETAERATRAKSEFLATMSHEIRSPMSGLLGVLELLRATQLDPDQSRMAGMIHNSASMLLAVLNDILDFSKIEAGALSIALEPVALRALVADLVLPLSAAAAPKNLILRFSVDPGIPDCIKTDPLRLRQILGNLLSNALKFTPSGEVLVRVDMVDQASSTALRFRVRDTGIGMSADVLSRLFAPFMQADGSTTRNFGGTGLGLCISRQLAMLFGGDLTVTSQAGKGSEFTLELPFLPCDGQPDVIVAEAQAATALASVGKRVLIVEDDATIRWLSQRQLQKLGLAADIVDDGKSALSKLRTHKYDLVLTDCHMPLMDGVALTRLVRADSNPVLSRIPIIGLTADVTERQRALCYDAGMNELVIKPLSVERLSQLLHKHLPADSGSDASAETPTNAITGPKLRRVVFDDQIYLSIFERNDADGAVWLTDWLAVARRGKGELGDLLSGVPGTALARDSIAKVAHSLAGSAFSVGAMLLGEAARALELASDQAVLAGLRVLYGALAQAFAAAEAEIWGFLDYGGEADQT
jgi:light-regulated signal transduction histidine kinase (bacteriophytochrome)/ActR/RegA family two-component response regulator/HPt (histidine-containing phosphotransfer) domain-containing protein